MTAGRKFKNKHGFTVTGKIADGKIVKICEVFQSRDARDTIYELLMKDEGIRNKYKSIDKAEV